MGQFGNQPDFATNDIQAVTPTNTISSATNLDSSIIYIGDNTTAGDVLVVIPSGVTGGFGVKNLVTVPFGQAVGTGYTTAGPLATTTSGSGTGCTVGITASAGAITAITITTPGVGYAAGDTITVTQGGAANGTFTISALKVLPPTATQSVAFHGLQAGGFLPVTVDYVLASNATDTTTVQKLIAAK